MEGNHQAAWDAGFAPGFRFSGRDAVVLVLGVAALSAVPAVVTTREMVHATLCVVAIPLIAFFLFCNVFRASRPLELGWAAAFVGLCYGAVKYDTPSWPVVPIWSIALIAIVIGVEMLKPSYHGVAWKLINPKLPDWWESQRSRLN